MARFRNEQSGLRFYNNHALVGIGAGLPLLFRGDDTPFIFVQRTP